jgi:hypothetical protein
MKTLSIGAVTFYLRAQFQNAAIRSGQDSSGRGRIFSVTDKHDRLLYRTHLTDHFLDTAPEHILTRLVEWKLIQKMKDAGCSIVMVDREGILGIEDEINNSKCASVTAGESASPLQNVNTDVEQRLRESMSSGQLAGMEPL